MSLWKRITRERYVATWLQRTDGGPWFLHREAIDDPDYRPWLREKILGDYRGENVEIDGYIVQGRLGQPLIDESGPWV